MSVVHAKVIYSILTDRFGPVVGKVGTFLLQNETSPLLFIKRGTDLTVSQVKMFFREIFTFNRFSYSGCYLVFQVKDSLCILIKYDLVTFKPNKNENLANYALNSGNVLLMLRYPKYLHHIKKLFGDESEVIIEEILQRGNKPLGQFLAAIFIELLQDIGLAQK